MKEILRMMNSMDMVLTPGKTVNNTWANGAKGRCMVKELSPGPTVKYTQVAMLWIVRKVSVFSSGLVAKDTRGTGRMGNNTVVDYV